MTASRSLRQALTISAMASAAGLCFVPSIAQASEADLLKRIEIIQAEISALKAQLAATPAAAPASKAPAPAVGGVNASSAIDGITISGKLDVAVESNSDGAVNRTAVQSHKSAIDFSAQRKLSDDLTGLAVLGTTIAPDATSGSFATRNSYVGLRSKGWGTILAGVYDDPFKQLQGTAAPVWGNADAMEVIINGKANVATVGATMRQYITRNTNVLQYMSPKWNSFSAVLHYATDEVNGATGTLRKPLYGGLVEYGDGTYNFGLASSTVKNFSGNDQDFNAYKATAGLRFGDASVGVAFSRFDNHAINTVAKPTLRRSTNNWLIAGAYKFGQIAVKANYAVGSESYSGAADGSKMFGFDVGYALDKNTTAYVYYATLSNDSNGFGNFSAGTNVYVIPVKGLDPHVLGLAVRYNY